jgi:tetratricopeptide (TPR) repeat protein
MTCFAGDVSSGFGCDFAATNEMLRFLSALQSDPQSAIQELRADGMAVCASVSLKQDDLEQALLSITEATELRPERADFWLMRGEVLRLLGHYEAAISDLDHGIELKPEDAEAIGTRGQVYEALGQLDRALDDFARAFALNSALDWIFYRLVKLHLRLRHFAEARDLLNTAIQREPTNDWLHYLRGRAYRGLGELDLANGNFRLAIRFLNENQSELITWYGQLNHALYYLALGEVNTANGLYQQVIGGEQDPKHIREALIDLETLRDDGYRVEGIDNILRQLSARMQFIEELIRPQGEL